MKGLVALITGGASGLGKGTVETLINHGLKVVIVDLPSSDGAEIAKYYGENCIFIPANVCIFLILILLYCVKFDFNFNEPIRILRERHFWFESLHWLVALQANMSGNLLVLEVHTSILTYS